MWGRVSHNLSQDLDDAVDPGERLTALVCGCGEDAWQQRPAPGPASRGSPDLAWQASRQESEDGFQGLVRHHRGLAGGPVAANVLNEPVDNQRAVGPAGERIIHQSARWVIEVHWIGRNGGERLTQQATMRGEQVLARCGAGRGCGAGVGGPVRGACLTIRTLRRTCGASPAFRASFCPILFRDLRHKSRGLSPEKNA